VDGFRKEEIATDIFPFSATSSGFGYVYEAVRIKAILDD
jgi:hypothetical protein